MNYIKLIENLEISAAVLRTARNQMKEAQLINFITGGSGYRVKTRYQILTPNQESNLAPSLDPLYKNKTKTKIDNSYAAKNGKISRREFITSGSDFDE